MNLPSPLTYRRLGYPAAFAKPVSVRFSLESKVTQIYLCLSRTQARGGLGDNSGTLDIGYNSGTLNMGYNSGTLKMRYTSRILNMGYKNGI